MIKLRLRDKWAEICDSLSNDDQVNFLKDSLSLYRKSPSHYAILYMVVLLFIVVIYVKINVVVARGLFILMLLHFWFVTYIYFKKLKIFKRRWY